MMSTQSWPARWLVVTFTLTGCATQQQTSSLECSVGAAAAAYIACKLLGNSDSSCAGFAAVGGGIGAAACYNYAGRLEQRRKALAGREQDLDAQLKYVRGLNEDGQQLNADLRERVNAASKRVADLSAQAARQKLSADQLAKERTRIDGEWQAANKNVDLQSSALAEVKTYQAKRTSDDLDNEIAKQEKLLADARLQVAKLASLRERVPSAA